MKPEGKEYEKPKKAVFRNKWFIVFAIAGVLLHLPGMHGMANFLLLMAILMVLNAYVLNDWIHRFQKKVLPKLMNRYEKLLRWVLVGRRPVYAFISLFGLFIFSVGLLMVRGRINQPSSQAVIRICICVFKTAGGYRCKIY